MAKEGSGGSDNFICSQSPSFRPGKGMGATSVVQWSAEMIHLNGAKRERSRLDASLFTDEAKRTLEREVEKFHDLNEN